MALAGGDAVDACLWWVSPSLLSVHAETGLSQVQILPARPITCNKWLVKGKIVSFQTTNRLLIALGKRMNFPLPMNEVLIIQSMPLSTAILRLGEFRTQRGSRRQGKH